MGDLIDRQVAIDRINKQRKHLRPDIYSRDKICDAAYRICAEFIERLPSAQPEIEERMSETEQNVPNDDFISRKGAIDAIEAVFPVDPMKSEYAQGIACGAALSKTYIEQFPSAQPDLQPTCNQLATDCISRQDAIDALGERPVVWTTDDEYSLGARNQYDTDKLAIETVPSAQPEWKWIPCTPDTMPDDLEEVYVTWVNHNPPWYYTEIKDKPFTAPAVYHRGKWYWYSSICVDTLAEYGKNDFDEVDKDIEIVAWCKIPEPYGGEQE